MKNIAIIIFAVFLSFSLMAQSNDNETLLSGPVENGGYGGLFTKIGQIDGNVGVFMGGQGGWIINHRLVLGAKGYGLVNKVEVDDFQNVKLEFGAWGGLVEYIFTPSKLIHFNLNTMIGAGGVKYAVIDFQEPHPEIDFSDDGLFVVEPGINLEINVHDKFRIGAGGTYRFVSGVDYADLTNSDLRGVSGEIILKFGSF